MATDFKRELKRMQKPVWQLLKSYLPNRAPLTHYRMVSDYPKRQGKYLRPGLLLLSTAMLGGSQKKSYLLAAAVQASEEWLLIHDDIEDGSLFRRSLLHQPRPTLHRLYGTELAINAGDALHIIMWRMVADATADLNLKLRQQIFNKINDILLTTTEGQFLDVMWIKQNKFKLAETDYYQMAFRKSAYYSIVGPLQLGAIMAGKGDAKTLAAIKRWATPLGYAFQIRDDLINLTQKSKISGKEQGGDILEGKRTLMLLHLLAHCTKQQRKRIELIYRKPRQHKTKADLKYVLSLMTAYGSLTYAADVVNKHCQKAQTGFARFSQQFPANPAQKQLLAAIAFVGQRVY